MHSISLHPVRLAIIFFFLLISCPPLRAQCGIFGSVGVISGNPFSAEIVSTSSGSLEDRSPYSQHPQLVARDSEGRVRFESIGWVSRPYTLSKPGPQAEQHLIGICDPVANTFTLIDTLKATVDISHSTSIPPSMHPLPSFCSRQLFRMPIGFSAGQDLGLQIIAGVQARGERVNTPLHPEDSYENSGPIASTRETWCSEELSAIVLRVTENISTPGKSESAMQNINRSEPDPALFQIPRGYSVTERGATGASPNSK
jgi:hypothetical protein